MNAKLKFKRVDIPSKAAIYVRGRLSVTKDCGVNGATDADRHLTQKVFTTHIEI